VYLWGGIGLSFVCHVRICDLIKRGVAIGKGSSLFFVGWWVEVEKWQILTAS
jgi:hypothetical protein